MICYNYYRQIDITLILKGASMLNVTIHDVCDGMCALTGKQGPGVRFTMQDGTIKDQFLSWKAFQQLMAMKVHREKGLPSPEMEK